MLKRKLIEKLLEIKKHYMRNKSLVEIERPSTTVKPLTTVKKPTLLSEGIAGPVFMSSKIEPSKLMGQTQVAAFSNHSKNLALNFRNPDQVSLYFDLREIRRIFRQ